MSDLSTRTLDTRDGLQIVIALHSLNKVLNALLKDESSQEEKKEMRVNVEKSIDAVGELLKLLGDSDK